MPAKVIPNIYMCHRCGMKSDTISNFYKIHNGVYLNLGYLPMCKACLNELFNIFDNQYGDQRMAIQRICMICDLYYSDAIFSASYSKDTGNFVLGNYIRQLSMLGQQGKSFSTSLSEDFAFGQFKTVEVNGETIRAEDVEQWGTGFEAADYEVLNSHYKLLKTANPNCDSNQEIFITDLCYTKMQQVKAVREGRVDDYNKLTDTYRKSFQQAGLKTVKETNGSEDFSLGVTGEMIERYTPAEYYKNKKLYKDHDNLGEYIERFLLRPLRNLMHGTNDRDYEYYVKDEEENVYSDDE